MRGVGTGLADHWGLERRRALQRSLQHSLGLTLPAVAGYR